MKIIHISIDARPGMEMQHWLAFKHRAGYARLIYLTPWWQFLKIRRRWIGWGRAIERYHASGQDRIEFSPRSN